jgi:multimeric flavodoxin WrbA/putative sterol carrier protein
MKVLALNGSPRMKNSSTYHMMVPFLEGMEAAGAETELVHIRKLHIEPCVGCYTCWVRTPGVCAHKDDMAAVLEEYGKADMVIFGTPLYHFSMTGLMKNFIDRTLPRLEPWLVPHAQIEGVTGHPERVHKPEKMFLISAAGFPEFEHFDSLVATFKQMARMGDVAYVGHILRPGAEPISRSDLQELFTAYYLLVRQAGEQVGSDGRISDDLQAALRQDLFPGDKEAFYQMSHAYWNMRMDKAGLSPEMRDTAPVAAQEGTAHPESGEQAASAEVDAPAGQAKANGNHSVTPAKAIEPQMTEEKGVNDIDLNSLTCREIIAGMPTAFNRQAADNMVADICFKVTGEEPGDYTLRIANGQCSFHLDASESPTLTIETPSEVWVAVSKGELDGQQAFMQQKYKASGDFGLLMKLDRLFSPA